MLRVSVGVCSACDCAEATRILSCHISVHVLEEKKSRPLVGLRFKQTCLTHSRLGWEKKENSIVFVRVIHEPKPQCVLFLPPVLYVKQFKWCNLQESFFSFLFTLASFPRLNLNVLGKEIEVSSSVSKRGGFLMKLFAFLNAQACFLSL